MPAVFVIINNAYLYVLTHSILVMDTTSRTRRAVLQAVGGATIVGTAATAAAKPGNPGAPVSGAGTGRILELETTNVREADGNRHEDRTIRGPIGGTLEGTFEQHTSGVVHKSGRVVFHGTMMFTGTVADCGEGIINLKVSGRGRVTPDGPITEGSIRVVNQAANTVGITGQGTVSQKNADITYEIQYRCR
jgi:hypothetical protein